MQNVCGFHFHIVCLILAPTVSGFLFSSPEPWGCAESGPGTESIFRMWVFPAERVPGQREAVSVERSLLGSGPRGGRALGRSRRILFTGNLFPFLFLNVQYHE